MRLVGNYDSPFVRRVAIALHHYGLPFDRQIISVFMDFDEMLETNPLGKVPALRLDDGETLIDSRIILDYLEGMVADDRRLLPVEEPERRRVLGTEAVALGLAEKSVELRIELYRKNPSARDPEWVSRLESQVVSALGWLESRNSAFRFHGDSLTLPDLTTAAAFTYLRHKLPDVVPQGKYPSLEGKNAHCESLSAFQAAPYSASEAQASEMK